MIERFYKLKPAIQYYMRREKVRYGSLVRRQEKRKLDERDPDSVTAWVLKNQITEDEWEHIPEIEQMLLEFRSATKVLEGRPDRDKNAGIMPVMIVFRQLLEKLEGWKKQWNDDPSKRGILLGIEDSWKKLDEYWEKMCNSPAYAAAIVLNPRWKEQTLIKEWTSIHAERHMPRIRHLWTSQYKIMTILGDIQASNDVAIASPQPVNQHSNPYLNLLDEVGASDSEEPEQGEIDELEVYLQEPRQIGTYPTAPQYWRQQSIQIKFPRLSRMAIDLMSIPAMSSECERQFSIAGDTMDENRASLHLDTFQALLSLKSWIRAGAVRIDLPVLMEQSLNGGSSQSRNSSQILSQISSGSSVPWPPTLDTLDGGYGRRTETDPDSQFSMS